MDESGLALGVEVDPVVVILSDETWAAGRCLGTADPSSIFGVRIWYSGNRDRECTLNSRINI